MPVQPPQTLDSVAAYDKWAASYPPHAHNALMQAEEAAMKSLLLGIKGQVVLDLACGTGRYGLMAMEQGAAVVIGLDNSAAMLKANRLVNRALSSSEAIPLASGRLMWCCVVWRWGICRLGQSMCRLNILKPGGWALVSDFHPLFFSWTKRRFGAPDDFCG